MLRCNIAGLALFTAGRSKAAGTRPAASRENRRGGTAGSGESVSDLEAADAARRLRVLLLRRRGMQAHRGGAQLALVMQRPRRRLERILRGARAGVARIAIGEVRVEPVSQRD